MTKPQQSLDLGQLLKSDQRFQLAEMDAVTWLKQLPPESVDLIVTDPAYESLEEHRAVGTTTRLTNDWFEIFPNARFPELFAAAFRALKPNTHLYLMCDQKTAFVVKPMGEAAGFKFWKPLVWEKQSMGMGYHYRARYEFVMFFEKGKRNLNDFGICDVLSIPKIRNGYPTEKPVALSELLIGQSTEVGEIVADPFMGSGSVGVASLQQKRRFVGTDISPKARALSFDRCVRAIA